MKALEFTSLPRDMDNEKFMHAMLGSQFMVYHDFAAGRTFLILESDNGEILASAIHGMQIKEMPTELPGVESASYFIGYRPAEETEEEDNCIFKELYDLFGRSSSRLIVSFVPSTIEHVLETKERVEELASGKAVRLTRNVGSKDAVSSSSDSLQTDIFYRSDERHILLSLLSMLNETYLNNGTSYKVGIVADSRDEKLIGYIKSRMFVFEERRIKARTVDELWGSVKRADALPFSYGSAADFINFSGSIPRESVIETQYSPVSEGIPVGRYLDGGRGEDEVRIDPVTLNLGTVISGLPGTGKTATAMSIVSKIRAGSGTGVAVISPTREWGDFAAANGMRTVRLYDGSARINFFRCDSAIRIEKFYENLAMLLASASNAGPYRNSLEKCLLAAFRRVYSSTSCPDPSAVYDEIESSVIEQHGRRTGSGVVYTKHGENVMAALESLRLMLLKPQFAYSDGISFRELLGPGVIFDLSEISNNMKPFFYALILNQVYGIADAYDENGNDSLRLLICLEEAQLVFENSDESAATLDLKQRIQDFRKKGIGLMLITHNITDINVAIRRLCQLKLYFRQSSDVAQYACADLAFGEDESAMVTDRLKSLPQAVLALSHLAIEEGERVPKRPIFLKADPCGGYPAADRPVDGNRMESIMPTRIRVLDAERMPRANAGVELVYVGETVYRGTTDADGRVEAGGTMEGKQYRLRVIGKRKRETRTYSISGGSDATIINEL